MLWSNAPWKPRKWQKEAMPIAINALRQGKRPIISAIMGSGKSVFISELVYTAMQKLAPGAKIIIAAPRKNLVNQLSSTVAVRCGEDNVGRFFSDAKDVDKKIIVTTFISAIKLADHIGEVAMLVCDEVHGTEADVFKIAFDELKPACAIGFTATPFRSNEKEKLSLWEEVVYRYTAADALADKVIVPWELLHWDGHGSNDIDEVCLKMAKNLQGAGIVSALDIEDAEAYSNFLDKNGVPSAVVHSKLTKDHRQAIINCLRRGEIKCVVHVSLLSEGVDLPFLSWIILRRPVGAKVRFVQEVGRVLRAHPGKDVAYIGDPHNLFGQFSLHNPAQLGEYLTAAEQEYEEALVDLEPDPEKREKLRNMPPAKAFNSIDSYVISLLSVLRSAGICGPASEWGEGRNWRGCSPSRTQMQTLEKTKWSTRYLPTEVREPFKLLVDQASKYNRGTASDMISILIGLASSSKQARQRKTHWHIPKIRYPKPDFPIQQLIFVMENH